MILEEQEFRFAGADYRPGRDNARLSKQLIRIFNLMRDGRARTLAEIAAETGDPEPSISAQLRHMRKERFGAHTVLRQNAGHGLRIYTLIVNPRHTSIYEE